MADLPPLPPGFKLENKPDDGSLSLDDYTPKGDVKDLGRGKVPRIPDGFKLEATGEVVDGDTLRLQGKRNGRVLGFDAFESDQPGIGPDGRPVPLGEMATAALDAAVSPETGVTGAGSVTYGRPVVTLDNGGADPIVPMLRQGHGYAAPEYLKGDPERSATYTEAERLARLNLQGGHGTQHLPPDVQRMAERGPIKLRPGESIEFTNDLPELRPEFQRLPTELEQEYYGMLARHSGDKNFGQATLDEFWKSKGKEAMAASPEFIAAIRNGHKFGMIDYSGWDAATLADFEKQNAFAGMRPEVQSQYGALLAAPDFSPEKLKAFADAHGMTFDPRDVDAFIAARAAGKDAKIPLPIIDPGDGKTGAFARGAGDPVGFLDEMGGVVDTLGGTDYRENIWNSDRSFGDIYENNTRQNRAIIDFDETAHPYMRAGGQIVSGIILPFGGGVRSAGGFAKAGAIEGGIYGFGSGDGTLTQRLMNVPGNAAVGAAGGATVGKLIEGGKAVFRRATSAFSRGGKAAANDVRADAFAEALEQQVGPDARNISRDQIAASFEAADNAAARAEAAAATDARDIPPIPKGFEVEQPARTPRADMEAEPNPSLTGPRQPDRIDVAAGNARPLADGPTPAMVQAATSDARPSDVLPRAANEIEDFDEAASIDKGIYPEVKAPRERDYLETRHFPARNNPDKTVSQRGPLDLVSFARAQGGLRDEGGELASSGITNTPRQGDDFTGGERFLGRLVDNENGTNLDEFAHRAWREGYFPELDSPPTIQQVVAALDDTYRGVGRRFRPEDEGQIQAFEAARDQRLAVERAKQEGAPLVADLGQPATMDDIIKNTPPASAYEDWDAAALSKVGNVRVDKLDTPQDISRALSAANRIAGGFDNARRGKITQAETAALASDLGMTADQLLTRRKGTAFNAEQALAARRILAKSGNELVNLARRVQQAGDDPGSEMLAAFRKALVRHTAIQEQVSGGTAEAGRALAQFRMVAGSKEIPGRVLDGLVSAGGGPTRLKEAAEAIIDLERDPANLNRFIEKASKPRFKDKLVEVWYNFLLSGPQTHAVNILSNTMTSLGQIPEHMVAAGIGRARRALNPKAVDRVTSSEVGARAIGLMQGTKEGLREIADRFRKQDGDPSGAWNGVKRWGNAVADVEPSDFVSKIEGQSQKAVSGVKGKWLRVPSSALTIEDEFFKGIARRMELTGLAVRSAERAGLKGDEAKAHIAGLIANPPDAMLQQVMDYGRYLTFQRPLGPVGSKLSAITNDMPIFKAVLPFIRTPINLFKFTAERSPVAFMLKEWRKDFLAGGAQRDLAVARAMVGTGVGAVVAELAAQGKITGSTPGDDNRARLLRAQGWQPYSIKIGDQYYSYRRLDPFAMTFGTAADIATLGDNMTDKQREEGVGLVFASVVSNIASKTWLSGLTDALEAISDPERYGDAFIERLAGSVTVPTGVAQVARTIDPTMRETPDVGSAIQARIPGMSAGLYPKRDVWGEPIVGEGGVGPDIVSPIWTSTAKDDPISQEALRVGATVSMPRKGDMTPDQFDRLQATAGPLARDWLSTLIESPDYQAMGSDDRAGEIEKTIAAARKAAKANVLGGDPLPLERPSRRR